MSILWFSVEREIYGFENNKSLCFDQISKALGQIAYNNQVLGLRRTSVKHRIEVGTMVRELRSQRFEEGWTIRIVGDKTMYLGL